MRVDSQARDCVLTGLMGIGACVDASERLREECSLSRVYSSQLRAALARVPEDMHSFVQGDKVRHERRTLYSAA